MIEIISKYIIPGLFMAVIVWALLIRPMIKNSGEADNTQERRD